jgi:Cytochrome oxidase c subunit VIb
MAGKIPLRDERKLCYEARDTFFTCCDRNKIENPLREVDSVQRLCKGEKAKFEKDCISSWVFRTNPQRDGILLIASKVEYFMRKRIIDKRKELMYADGSSLLPKEAPSRRISG